MIQRYHNEPVGLRVTPEPGDYLKLHDHILPDGSEQITVGRCESWSVLACKEVYGKASKAVQASGAKSAVFDLSAAAELGRDGLLAAAEGICGGAYQMKYTLSDQWEPEFACYASGEGWQEQDLQLGWTLAESILRTRSLVNRPANLLTPERLAAALTEQCAGLPVETQCYDRGTLHELGLEAFLAVGDSSGHPPVLAVLRYTGAPDSAERLGLVGKGVTVDSGGYNLKSSGSMAGIKGDMAGGAAVAAAVRAGAAGGGPVNVPGVVPCCENRICTTGLLPGEWIVVRQDHRGIQCRRRGPPHSGRRPDVGHPEGGLHAPCGRRHADGRDLRHAWLCGHGRYGERRRLVCHARAGRRPLRRALLAHAGLPGI